MDKDNKEDTRPTPEEREEAFRKELETPIDRDEAEKAFADIDVQLARLSVQRVRAVAQMDRAKQVLNQIDEQIGLAQLERQVVYRRALNVPAETEAK